MPSCSPKMRLRFFCLWCFVAFSAVAQPAPKIVRVFPLGGQAGTPVDVEILGELLSNATGVEFDCTDLTWTETKRSSYGKLTGRVSISANAALGPHMFRVATRDGYSTSLMFNVGQFPSKEEVEPNDHLSNAQTLTGLPLELQGRLDGAPDADHFAVRVQARERWLFELKAIEQGSAVEARMILFDDAGRQIVFNDDRGDFDENPIIEHAFQKAGTYYLKLDQYRGPRGFNFGKNCSYILRISKLPVIESVAPLGLSKGKTTRIRIAGRSLQQVDRVLLTKVRRAEYAHMTFPFTMPIDFHHDPKRNDSASTINGTVVKAHAGSVEAEFAVPSEITAGLWKLWAAGPDGVAEAFSIEVGDGAEYEETAYSGARQGSAFAINGALSKAGEADVYPIEAVAGQPIHVWTLAAQLGIPYLDSVLRLRDAAGKKLAENDDVVAGQGTLIGNPDSSLFYTPAATGPLFLEVTDRLKRGGPGFEYRLKAGNRRPSFQLFTTPENFTVARGRAAELKVHLVREAGFEGEVSVWFDGLPPGVESPKGKFRADQLFEPNADGADMIIPEITFPIRIPESLAERTYNIRVVGCATADEAHPDRQLVEAHSVTMIGPLLDIWNYLRRPVPSIAMTVIEPFDARVLPQSKSVSLKQGETAALEFKLEHVPISAPISLLDLPQGVTAKPFGRDESTGTIMLQASSDAEAGMFAITAEATVRERRASSTPITVSISGK